MQGGWGYAILMTTSAMNGKSVSVIILLLYAYKYSEMRGGWRYVSEPDLDDNICDEWEECKRHYFIVVHV
jgi:hypothetical protein